MFKVTLEFATLALIVALCLVIALALMLKSLFPYLVIGLIVYFLYRHNNKDKPHCPMCEVKDKVNHL